MNFHVKICGITNWKDAQLACDAGADALGFNFHPGSPRCIAPAAAWEILKRLPHDIVPVGVFVDWSAEAVAAMASAMRLGAVQLHGAETARTVASLSKSFPVIKALRVGRHFRSGQLRSYPQATAFLLDGFSRRVQGGSGTMFDWKIARRAGALAPVIVAGGLTHENVARAIAEAKPAAVDVASGVELRPGKKDAAKVRTFVKAALEAFSKLRK